MTAAEFRAARKALKLSQAKLADALMMSTRSILLYEGGHQPIPRTVELAVAYLVTLEYLLTCEVPQMAAT